MFNKILAGLVLTSGFLNYWCNLTQDTRALSVAAICTAITVIVCLFRAKGTTKFIGIILFFLGISLLVSTRAKTVVWYDAFHKNGSLLAILIIVPMIGIVFQYPYYLRAIEETVRRNLNSKHKLYSLLFLSTHTLSVPLNFTSIPICNQLVERNLDQEEKRTALTAIARGYTSILLWSPNTGSMALVLYWGAQWFEILLPGLFFVLIALIVGWIVELFRLARTGCEKRPRAVETLVRKKGSTKSDNHRLSSLVITFVLILAVVVSLDIFTNYKALNVIPVVAILFPLVWSVLTKTTREYFIGISNYFNRLAKMTNEVVIFVGAGFFATAVAQSQFNYIIVQLFAGTKDNTILFVIIMGIVIIGLSIVGFHPALTVTNLSTSVYPLLLGFSPRFVALTALTWWSLAVTISPISITSLSVSSLSGKSQFRVSLIWNCGYVSVLFLLYTMMLYALNTLLGY